MKRLYELTFVSLDEAGHQDVADLVEQIGADIKHRKQLGRKAFAYPIRKETAGFYHAFELMLEPDRLTELAKKLTARVNVLRHLIVAGGITPPKSEDLAKSVEAGMKELVTAETKADRGLRQKKLDETLEVILKEDSGE